MGRYAGWIALNSGLAAGAHAILIPEIPFTLEPVAAMIARREERGARFAVVVVAEGARPRDGVRSVIGKSVGQEERLGGIGAVVAAELERLTGKEARTVVLGHLLRGGTPTSLDRLLGLRFGAAAIRGIEEGQRGVMVAHVPPSVSFVPLVSAVAKMHSVPLDCDTVISGRDLGVSFGDE
jgi:6-phosphofructokinase 1